MISFIIPSRSRIKGLLRAIDSIQTTTANYQTEIIAVLDEPDQESITTLTEVQPSVRIVTVDASHLGRPQRKYNAGYAATKYDWIVTGADDIEFQPDWLDYAFKADNRRGTVVGLYDGVHDAFATLFMAHRTYIDNVMRGKIGLPWYHVWMADMEWTERARKLGLFVMPRQARFVHHHPLNQTAENDDIYRLAQQWYAADDKTYQRRSAAGFPDPDPEGIEV